MVLYVKTHSIPSKLTLESNLIPGLIMVEGTEGSCLTY